MNESRSARVRALEEWAEHVEATDLRVADTKALRTIAALADQRAEIDDALEATMHPGLPAWDPLRGWQ